MNRYEKGYKQMQDHLGKDVTDEYIKKIEQVAPFFAQVNVEFPFGDLYSHESTLDQRVREIATIAALTVQGFSIPQLKVHIRCGINCGVTKEEIVEIITQMIAYCGFPAATNAILAAKEVFEEMNI
ncbi:carboxymuconolactone decarboxylase family protein [Legionella hackeliae]|uniref:Carboxymuconolactone decarboxylase family protein n=1 Tax=Legionella hackeliae TaxID=449 RepID=A0A0A8UUE2_LEGHA|nr:carboxymuconolactone decarboxylase family protein [Legionella hackeliae]KTD11475.1 Carboxymuconolactone decarboxylase family protein [Legionella hackeliae]CEK10692.1 Carboxymuconolactone decarboxylase family protein [Legionella hackeliae]STX47439.1 4-carboxymuconolactone decarboxylase [Legionella hackeliae]